MTFIDAFRVAEILSREKRLPYVLFKRDDTGYLPMTEQKGMQWEDVLGQPVARIEHMNVRG